ncbi:MAG: flagellar motor protein MotB [Alistipes sp.]|nr:flagellar motor protein MotB [Alistipes sp.]
MARKKQEDAPKGSPAWMSTFSDLMNLLLCFFVLLFSMSTVDAEKFAEVMASIQSSFSIMPSGGSALDDGVLISSGVSQLSELSQFYTSMGMNTNGDTDTDDETSTAYEKVEAEMWEESQRMAEYIEEQLEKYNLTDEVELYKTSSYVMLNMNGGILFDSGKDELKPESLAILERVSLILQDYDGYVIEVVGHTDNVPIHSAKFPDNTMLSMCRAYSVYRYFVDNCGIDPVYMKSSGRGENVPMADNSTAEGRAQNRRVEIKIYNSFTTN